MRAQLLRPDLADEDRYHLHFAIGKALEEAVNTPSPSSTTAWANACGAGKSITIRRR